MVTPNSADGHVEPHIYDESGAAVYYVPGGLPATTEFSPYDTDSDTASLCSQHSASTLSTQEARGYFQEVGGRLYPVDPELPIFMPQDGQETQRLDREHVALKLVLGCNYVGPVASHLRHDPLAPRKRVLDIGTQQGTWVQEMATEFPHVDFVSLDFSPMAPHTPRRNITFEVYDLYAGLAEGDASFDMIHVRHTANKVGNYRFLMQELHRVLRPGGLFISGEFENEIYEAENPDVPLVDAVPRLSRALGLVRQALAAQNVTVDAGRRLPDILAESSLFAHVPSSLSCALSSESDSDSSGASFSTARSLTHLHLPHTAHGPNLHHLSTPQIVSGAPSTGFTQISPVTYHFPATPWPDPRTSPQLHTAGRLSVLGLQHGWPSLVPLLTVHAGLSAEDAREVVNGALADHFVNPRLKLVMKFHTVWAFKIGGRP